MNDKTAKERDDLAFVQQLLRAGRLVEAHRACTGLLSGGRSNPEAWFLLSNLNLRTGRLDDAAECARMASSQAPGQPKYLIQAGTCLAVQGRIGDALQIAHDVSRLNDLAPTMLSNLGSLFSMCESFEQAAQFFQEAVNANGGSGEFWYNLATAHRALGNLSDAEFSCDNAIRLNPRDGQAHYLRSDLRKHTVQTNHVRELEEFLADKNCTLPDRVFGYYALAKEFEDLGRYEQSFYHLKSGADTYRQTLDYDVAKDIRVIDRIIAIHTRDALSRLPRGYERADPIFVVGLPRSGTTLTERLIRSHSAIHSVGERNDFAVEMSRLAAVLHPSAKVSRERMVEHSLEIDMSQLGARYVERVNSGIGRSVRTLDKMPVNYLYCGLIHAALPCAKIILLKRNAMDSCYAAYKAFLKGPYSFTYNLEELGSYYVAYRRLAEHWRSTLPRGSYLELEYETLVGEFEAESRRILEFLDLPWEDQVLEFHKNEHASSTASAVQIRQSVYSTSVGIWKHYAGQLAPLQRIVMGKTRV